MRKKKEFWNWSNESGFIVSAELVSVATIVVISMVVGLASIRNQVVQELIDVAQAMGSINQTFGYCGIDAVNVETNGKKHGWAYCGGASYDDMIDYCQQTAQKPGAPAGGIHFMPMNDVGLTGELTYPVN